MLFLKFLPGLVSVLGVFASTLSLVGSVLARQLFLESFDLGGGLFLKADGDATIQNKLASGLDVEVDPGDRERGFGFRLPVLVAGNHQKVVARPLNQVGIG